MNPPSDTLTPDCTPKRKPRTCPHCKRRFRRHEHLQRHIRIHTNEKPYKCSCGASFGRRDLLKRHEDIGHSSITSSIQEPSPVTTDDSRSLQSRGNNDLTPQHHGTSFWGLPDLPGADVSAGTIDPQEPLPDLQFEGGSFLNAQDLLVLQDLESFSHNMGLSTEWALPSEPGILQIVAGESNLNSLSTMAAGNTSQERPSSQSDQHQSLSQLPIERESVAEFGVLTLPIVRITDDHRNRLLRALGRSHTAMPEPLFPSCHSLTRFVNGFFDGFYPHIPVVHIPTFKAEDCEPEIVLAMAALGAQYRHEHRKAVLLFYAAKATLQQNAHERERMELNKNVRSGGGHATCPETQSSGFGNFPYRQLMRETRCALYLIAFATWQSEPEIVREAFNLQSFLARCVRECQLDETQESLQQGLDWHSWVEKESDRRVKLFSFALLNLHGIAFGTPPVILSDEVHLRLPSTCFEWIAPNKDKWSMVHKLGNARQMLFQEALSHLLNGSHEPHLLNSQPVPSPLANYILLHALIQRIMLVQRAFNPYTDEDHTLLNRQKEVIRNALHAWTSQWQRAPESSLDPRNPNGPVTFTSTALLGVAYVRLAFNIGSYKILGSRNPQEIAERLRQMPRLPSGPHLLPAILHATHALSIPVKLGVNFVSRSHAFVWSIQHSLCGLEFAIFLSKWLFCISNCQKTRPLDEHESRLISWIGDIVEEGRTSGDEDLWSRPTLSSNCAYLGFAVIKLWATLIKGNDQWAILRVIGEGLDIYANICERTFTSSLAEGQ
ncbi:unnamed protein product [Penicillium egyptiacum]|uniref:C2H2-type domain-containing protein n=1 Tax=Penicillium egyptiacum TaxID=1303716 RepID=A0A9W4K6V5_9EURO|nr:unnamed protein product [Penicillium egyptiacum]